MKLKSPRVAFAVIFAVTALPLPAATMIFTHAGAGSGTLNGVPFDLTGFTITATGETDGRLFDKGNSVIFVPHTLATIAIGGLGTFSFLDSTRTFVNQSAMLIGFSREGVKGRDLFNGPGNEQLAAWAMLTDIGPLTGEGILMQWNTPAVETSGGILVFNPGAGPATFTARLVPEPGATVFFLAVAGAFVARRRR